MFQENPEPHLAARLQSMLDAECQRRQQFYVDIDDDMTAEFINGEVVVHSPVKKEHTDVTGFCTYSSILSCASPNLATSATER